MRSMLLITSALLLLAGCGPTKCPRCTAQCGPTITIVQRHGYEFRSDPNRPHGWHVYRGGQQVGYYADETTAYWPFDSVTRTFGQTRALPWITETPTEKTPVNYGVDTARVGAGAKEIYRLNGQAVDRETALRAVQGKELPDDRQRLRLTIIGAEEDRKRVLADLAAVPELTAFRDRLVVQDYPPDHWAVAGTGFRATGSPNIYLQLPSGRVLHRQDDYRDGAAGLVQALRRASPDYRPDRDPDLRKETARFFPANLPLPVLASMGGLVILFFLPR